MRAFRLRDFLPNIRGIGIKKAHALVAKHRSVAAVLAVLHGDKKIHVPPGSTTTSGAPSGRSGTRARVRPRAAPVATP